MICIAAVGVNSEDTLEDIARDSYLKIVTVIVITIVVLDMIYIKQKPIKYLNFTILQGQRKLKTFYIVVQYLT